MKQTNFYSAVLAAIVASLLLSTGCEEMEIPYGKLPAAARTFIEHYFPTETCVYSERDRDDGQREYEVRLSNGTEIQFNGSGDWKKVDCKYLFLPDGIVPAAIVADLAVRYPGVGIYKAERERGGYEISITNGLKLIYTADGVFVRKSAVTGLMLYHSMEGASLCLASDFKGQDASSRWTLQVACYRVPISPIT